MDLNYDIRTWDVPLQTMTLTKITQQLVENAISDPYYTTETMTVALRASENAQKLKLPLSLITKIQKMVRPITDEMLIYYCDYGSRNRVILTALGTVDAEKTARAWMNCSDRDPCFLFRLACRNCFEDEIFLYGKQNTYFEQIRSEYAVSDELTLMPYFWFVVYNRGRFIQKITKKDLCDDLCQLGLILAMKSNHPLAMKYFLDNISLTNVDTQSLIADRLYERNVLNGIIIPDVDFHVCAKILRISKFVRIKENLSLTILNSLLKWPYQHLFLEAAQTLTANLNGIGFMRVLDKIAEKKSRGYEDSDYVGLFTGFWKICKDSIREMQANDPILVHFLLSTAFETLDKNIAFMMFEVISEDNMTNYTHDCLIDEYANKIYVNRYEEVLFMMIVCKAKCERLYLGLKNYLEFYFDKPKFPDMSEKQWKDNVQEFTKTMSEFEL